MRVRPPPLAPAALERLSLIKAVRPTTLRIGISPLSSIRSVLSHANADAGACRAGGGDRSRAPVLESLAKDLSKTPDSNLNRWLEPLERSRLRLTPLV